MPRSGSDLIFSSPISDLHLLDFLHELLFLRIWKRLHSLHSLIHGAFVL